MQQRPRLARRSENGDNTGEHSSLIRLLFLSLSTPGLFRGQQTITFSNLAQTLQSKPELSIREGKRD